MSWLVEQPHICVYRCGADHSSFWEGDWDLKPPSLNCECEGCLEMAQYAGFEPVKLGGTTVVEYEQNGRRAYRIKHANGNVTHVSATRRLYQETSRIEHQYTKGYVEQATKSARERDSQAKVSTARHRDKEID